MFLLKGIISSATRIKILMRLFHNPEQRAYLRELANEFGVSSSQVNYELKQLFDSRLVECEKAGRYLYYRANKKHPLFPELHSMVRKVLGMDPILEQILEKTGDLDLAMLVDDYAEGKDTGIIDLILVGKIDEANVRHLVAKTESHIDRKIRTLVLTRQEYKKLQPCLKNRPRLTLFKKKKVISEKHLGTILNLPEGLDS